MQSSPGAASKLSEREALLLRLRAQRLWPASATGGPSVAGVVADICGIQAQDAGAAALAIRARSAGLAAEQVERARVEERAIVRSWFMRGTLHLVATADAGWLLALLGPTFTRPTSRHKDLGLDEEQLARGVAAIGEALATSGSLNKAELAGRVAPSGVPVAGQAIVHLIGRAALQGIVCLGPERGGKPTYVLLDGWAGSLDALPREAALAELARRYLAAYGPAGPDDLAYWSGLPSPDVRAAWESVAAELAPVEVAGRPSWMLKSRLPWLDEAPSAEPLVRLLPAFDTYLLGYRDRGMALAPEHARRIHPGGGLIHPALLVDGRVEGTWRGKRQGGRFVVELEPFAPLDEAVRAVLDAEVADVGRFLGLEATLRLAGH